MIKQYEKTIFALPFLFIILLTAALISCNDSSVSTKQNYNFDPPRYSWAADTITDEFIFDGWYNDTNIIFFLSGNSITKYDGNVYTKYYFPASFTPYCITGFDENNVYAGGSHLGPNNNYSPMLKKWTGGSFIDFSLDETTDQADKFFTVFSTASNELWLSAAKGKIYRFDGNNFQTFNFDTNYSNIAPFMKDEANNIYFAGKIFYGNNVVDSVLIELQKYNNPTWEKIYSSVRHGGEINFFTQNIGSGIFAVGDQQIYKFNGSNFVSALTIDAFSLLDGTVSGPSISSFTCKGIGDTSHTDCLFNWNGNKWSREFTISDRNFTKIIYSSGQRTIVLDYDYLSGKTYIIKGKKK